MHSSPISLAGFTIRDVIYAVDETIVARADTQRGERVVLKYQDSLRPVPELLARWHHEHAVLRSIDSKWVIRTLGLKEFERNLVLVLEDFGSTNLVQLIAQQPLDLTERLAIAIQLASALADVHAHGLIHGDIAPKNVLVEVSTMRLKLCDFGLSSRLDHEQKRSDDNFLRGTLAYMSPEQTGRTNLDVDYRSDLYSLGISLYELFSGRKPFHSNDPMTLLHAQIAIMPVPLHKLDPLIPEPISEIVQKLLAKFPDDRYQSSFGLIRDLSQCSQQWQRFQRIAAFPLAQADVPERFCVAQKLYGREAECAQILGAFARAAAGGAELLLISGYSGIGKSALVNELHRPIIAERGYLIRGKCDQYSRNQPYSALIQAFQQLLRQLATEGEERRGYWKAKLIASLGEHAGAVCEIIPNLALIMGAMAALPPLPAAEKENRFHIAFAQFVNALASSSHPLLLFLDDLQWADAPTLKLLQHLLQPGDERSVLIVGAFRDNEVDESHLLSQCIAAIEHANARIEHLRLSNLEPQDVCKLVADTLHCSVATVAPLAALCFEKTRGNPFFLGQLLRTLHGFGDIHYQRSEGVWHWSVEHIQRRAITDNVVELMLEKVRILAPQTQNLLALAAHLGGSFDMRQLMAVCAQDVVFVASVLWPALQAGLVLPLNEHYKFADSPQQLQDARYRFLHDRVQQAAYQLTPSAQRMDLQLRCGRLLLAASSAVELDERLFIILHALNSAAALIEDPLERAQLLALNLRAGIKAKSASAFPTAVNLLRQAKALLAFDAWTQHPEQCLSLYCELAEAEYLSGNFAQAETLYPEGIAASPNVIAKVTLCLVQVDQYHIQGRFADSYPVLNFALELLGGSFPATEEQAGVAFVQEFARTEALLAQQEPAQLLSAPEMTQIEHLLEMRIYFALSYSTYQTGRFNAFVVDACRMVQATLRNGQGDLSCIGYVAYVTAMSAAKRPYALCFQMGKLALTLAEQRENRYFRLTVYQYFSAFYQHWGEPLSNTLFYLDRGLELGQSGINPLAAGYCALLGSVNRFVLGTTLDVLQVECERGCRFLQQSHQPNTENMLRYGVLQPLLALRGIASDANGALSAAEFFNGDYKSPSITLALNLSATLRHSYLLDDCVQWRQSSGGLGIIGMCLPDSPSLVDAMFFTALGLLRSELNANEVSASLTAVEGYLANFQHWAVACSDNFLHKALLIEAELARVRNDESAAMDLYAQAIDAAAEAGFCISEAIANELYARFWLARKQKQLANNFIRDAYYHYRRWGAEVKCRQLESSWPSISFRALERQHGSSQQTRSYRSGSEHSDQLDLHSLLKANQLLAKEIQLNSLLQKMLAVLLENAGAEHGFIVLVDDETLIVEVSGGVSDGHRFDSELIRRPLVELTHCERPSLPSAIIEYVVLTRATLLLNNPALDQRFSNSRYLMQRQPKSVLCLPVNAQGKLVALVYLENNLMESVFTVKHQQTLELLSSQAAISLVNARLYENLEQKVLQRTEELRQMSMKDGLTGIANRRSFDERLAVELRRGQRSQSPLSLLMIDIDHFKQYNDHYGHFEGDGCIKAVAGVLNSVVSRASDLVARYGGEEFAVLLTDTDADSAVLLANACLSAMAELDIAHASSPLGGQVSISIGICTLTVSGEIASETLITRADQALYQAKREGRKRYCQFLVQQDTEAA